VGYHWRSKANGVQPRLEEDGQVGDFCERINSAHILMCLEFSQFCSAKNEKLLLGQ
jgi:hypothetical protein